MKLYIIIILLFTALTFHAGAQTLLIWGDDVETNSFNTSLSELYGIDLITNHIVALKDSISTTNYFNLHFEGLPGDSIVNIALVENLSSEQILLSENVSVPSSGVLDLPQIFVSNLGIYGSFSIEVFTPTYSYWRRFNQQPIFIEKAITKTIPGTNKYKFMIRYADNYISSPDSVFVEDYITNALMDSWEKEVIEWNLCEGLPGNIPLVVHSVHATDCKYRAYFPITPLQQQQNIKLTT